MKKITPCLWFDNGAEDAANFYVSVFPNSKITHTDYYNVETPSNKAVGSVMTVTCELEGNEFMLLNGGPYFKITEAVSFIIPCEGQADLDYYYEKMSSDPEAEVCGWLKDKFGVSWQLLPNEYLDIMESTDESKKKKVMEVLMNMKRLNVAELLAAAEAD